MSAEFWSLTFPPLLIAAFCALACTLVGNFLILRQQAMLGDAVSHGVLPGIVVAFLITGRIETLPMLLGALGAGLFTVLSIEFLRQRLRIEPSAAIGLTFSVLFASGVVLLEGSDAASVHLDIEHALYGNLESLVWLAGQRGSDLLDPVMRNALPAAFFRLFYVFLFVVSVILLTFRGLVIASFDPVYAQSRGVPVRMLGFGLSTLLALVAVASFEAVGSILVIAMLVCPPAAARLVTNNLGKQISLSLFFALFAACGGTLIAGYGPELLGLAFGISAAGSIAMFAGIILALCASFVHLRGR